MIDFDPDVAEHSPLGASGAERWMNCPGSVSLLQGLLREEESDEPDYRRDGTCAHEVAAYCLVTGCDAWEMIGSQRQGDGVVFTQEMASAVQVYLDVCRETTPAGAEVFIEHRVFEPGLHPYFFGQVDYGWIKDNRMEVTDYKHGQGIVVEVEGNPQPLYYARGLLEHPLAKRVEHVRTRIVQPRAFHPGGPIREAEIGAHELFEWARETLLPAMQRAQEDKSLLVGKWCRFCPAKLLCPGLGAVFKAMALANPEAVQHLSDEALSMEYRMQQAVEFYQKALKEETLKRALRGAKFADAKLVAKKADRVFRDGAEERIAGQFGDAAYTRAFKSPPQIEKLGGDAKELVKEWAFTPNTGYTIAPREDKRHEVTVETGSETFKEFAAKLENEG